MTDKLQNQQSALFTPLELSKSANKILDALLTAIAQTPFYEPTAKLISFFEEAEVEQ